MVHVRLSHRLQYAVQFLKAREAMAALHEANAKAKRLQERHMDVAQKMMKWDAHDPVLQPERTKLDPDSTSMSSKSKRTLQKDPRPSNPVKHGTPKPPPDSQPPKPGAKPKAPTPARRAVQKRHK